MRLIVSNTEVQQVLYEHHVSVHMISLKCKHGYDTVKTAGCIRGLQLL